MAIKYLNWRGPDGLETIDELDTSDFKRPKHEQERLIVEYSMAGMGGAYWSSRPCKGWW